MIDNTISQSDIETLTADPSAQNKKSVIDKLSKSYNSNQFSQLQRDRAEGIFRALLHDSEVAVRKAISDNLVQNSDIPADIILSLAKDVEEISCPVLEFSTIITDEDLLEIISETNQDYHIQSIANRENVSQDISTAIINTNNEGAISNLLDNSGADINDAGYDKVIDNFADSEIVIDSLATRSKITQRIIDKMVGAISNTMRDLLEDRYKENLESLHTLFDQSTDTATMQILGNPVIDPQLIKLINILDDKGQLEDALENDTGQLATLLSSLGGDGKYPIIPALAIGNLPLLCIVLHLITDIPYNNIVTLISDQRGNAALLTKAKLPKRMLTCIDFVINIIRQIYNSGQAGPNNHISDNIPLFISELKKHSASKNINQLGNFIQVVEANDNGREEW